MSTLYESDFTRWTFEQAGALRAGRVTVAELEHIAEVLEDVGNNEKSAVESQLSRLLMHLLKWTYQPDRRGNSWNASIRNARTVLARRAAGGMLERHARDSFAWSYEAARSAAAIETDLPVDTFPVDCPWTYEQATDIEFYPK